MPFWFSISTHVFLPHPPCTASLRFVVWGHLDISNDNRRPISSRETRTIGRRCYVCAVEIEDEADMSRYGQRAAGRGWTDEKKEMSELGTAPVSYCSVFRFEMASPISRSDAFLRAVPRPHGPRIYSNCSGAILDFFRMYGPPPTTLLLLGLECPVRLPSSLRYSCQLIIQRSPHPQSLGHLAPMKKETLVRSLCTPYILSPRPYVSTNWDIRPIPDPELA